MKIERTPRKSLQYLAHFFSQETSQYHMRKQPKQLFEFGPFRLDVEKGRLSRSGEIILLPPKAVSLLLTLLKNQGKVIEKEVLLETLWPDAVVEDSNLTQTVHLLRKALGKDGHSEPRIETLPKIGYRLIAEVREVWEQEDNPAAKLQTPVPGFGLTGASPALQKYTKPELMAEETERLLPPGHGFATPVNGVTEKETLRPGASSQEVIERESIRTEAGIEILPVPRSSVLTWFQSHNVKISVLALAGILAGIIFGLSFALARIGIGMKKVEAVAVAVLPFHSLNEKNTAPLLSLGIAETLIAKLKGARVNVLPAAAISNFHNKNITPLEAGRQLEVDAVITGYLENVNGRLRLTVQVRRVTDGQILLNEKFDEPFDQSSKFDQSSGVAGSAEMAEMENRIVEKVTAALETSRGAKK